MRPSFLNRLSERGIHEEKVRSLFGPRAAYTADGPAIEAPLLVVAFQNRSGSMLLVDYLRQTGHFNCYGEMLNHDRIARRVEEHGIASLPGYFEHLREAHGKPGRIDCLKASWDQLLMLYRLGFHRMYSGFRIIHLRRQDVAAQAVSYAIALQTERWTSRGAADPAVAPGYDPRIIENFTETTLLANGLIPVIAAAAGSPLVAVDYEALTQRPRQVVRRCAALAGVDLSDWTPDRPRIRRQKTEVNDRHRADYLAALRKRAGFEG
jgi:LPS sulfotransferase NodH